MLLSAQMLLFPTSLPPGMHPSVHQACEHANAGSAPHCCAAMRLPDCPRLRPPCPCFQGTAQSPAFLPAGLSVVEEFVSAEDDPGELQRLSTSQSSSSDGSGSSPALSRSTSAASNAGGDASQQSRPAARSAGARLRRAARGAAAVAKAAFMLLVRLALLAATPLLVLLLRRLVRARRFWERGLASAWHDSSKLTREYVDAYR